MHGMWWSHHTHWILQSCQHPTRFWLSRVIFLAFATLCPYGKKFWFRKLKNKFQLLDLFFACHTRLQKGQIIFVFTLKTWLSWDKFVSHKYIGSALWLASCPFMTLILHHAFLQWDDRRHRSSFLPQSLTMSDFPISQFPVTFVFEHRLICPRIILWHWPHQPLVNRLYSKA